MAAPIEKLIQEAFRDIQNLNPEKLQSLIQKAFQVFGMIQEKIKSEDLKERQEGTIMAQGLKDLLSMQAEMVCKKAGIKPSQLISFSENPSYFTEEKWSEVKGGKKDLNALRDERVPNRKAKGLEKHKNKLKTRIS